MSGLAKIVVTAVGYVGDIAPFIEPARRLAGAGHDVTFVAPSGYRTLLADEPYAFEAYPLGDLSAPAMHADARHERLLRHPLRNSPRLARYYVNGYFAADPGAVADGWRQLLAGADAVVTGITPAPVVVPIARHLGVRSVVGTVVPMIIPTAHRRAPFVPGPDSIGRVANRVSWFSADLALHAAYAGPALNRLRAECGLPKALAPGAHGERDADRVVALTPEAFAGPGFADWPPIVWGGFSGWHPRRIDVPDEVDEFLDRGAPPVVVTLGSSAAAGATSRFAEIAAVITDLGQRALVVTGTEQLRVATQAAIGSHPSVLCTGFVPLAPVVRRARAAVISGSLGSVGVALHAGTPTVVVPALFDQQWNGRRVQQLGLGRRVTSPRGLRPAIAAVIADGAYAERTAAMADRIRDLDGARALTDATTSVL